MKNITKEVATCILFSIICAVSFSQTVATTQTLEPLKRGDYTIVGELKGTSQSNRFWILFIPIGGKSEEKRKNQAYQRAVRDANCDGIIEPKYRGHKVVVPLILFTFSHKTTIVTGKGYKIKLEEDMLH